MNFVERYDWMILPQWDCINWSCSPLSVDPGSAIAITFGATLCLCEFWWLARACLCFTEIACPRLRHTNMIMGQQYTWRDGPFWCINAGGFLQRYYGSTAVGFFTIPEPLRGRVSYGVTSRYIGLGFGIQQIHSIWLHHHDVGNIHWHISKVCRCYTCYRDNSFSSGMADGIW